MYVCVCHRVTDSDILEAASRGVTTLEDLGQQLKVATCCGRCSDCARNLLNEHHVSHCGGSEALQVA